MQTAPAKTRYCKKCGFQGSTAEMSCPRCHKPLQASSNIRIRGFLMVVLGGLLVASMSYITMWAIDAANPSAPEGPRFTGTQDQFMAILALFALIIVFGFATVLAGVWQVIFGRQNKIIIWGAVGFAVVMAIAAYLVSVMLD